MEEKYYEFLKQEYFNENKTKKYEFLNSFSEDDIETIAIALVIGREYVQRKNLNTNNNLDYLHIKNQVKEDLSLLSQSKDGVICYIVKFSNEKSIQYLEIAINEKQKYLAKFI